MSTETVNSFGLDFIFFRLRSRKKPSRTRTPGKASNQQSDLTQEILLAVGDLAIDAARLANAGRAVRHGGRGRGFVASRGGSRRGVVAATGAASGGAAAIAAVLLVVEQAEQVPATALLGARVAARIAGRLGFAARFAGVRARVAASRRARVAARIAAGRGARIAARVAAAAIKQAAESGEQFAHRVAARFAARVAARITAGVAARITFRFGFAGRFARVAAAAAAATLVRAQHPVEQLEAVALATNSEAHDQRSQKASPFHRTSSPSTANRKCAHSHDFPPAGRLTFPWA